MTLVSVWNDLVDAFYDVILYIKDNRQRIYWVFLITSLLLAFYVYQSLKIKRGFLKYIFSKKVWLSSSAFTDYFMILFNSVIKVSLIAPFLIYSKYLAYHFDEFLSHNFGLVDSELSVTQVMILFTATLTLLNDFTTYIIHYIMHKVPFLWEFHKIHHSATSLNPITQYRIHPFELIINNAKSILVMGLVMGLYDYITIKPINEWLFYGANVFSYLFMFWGANLRHSHVKLKYFSWLESLFISPFQHQIHHSNNPAHFNKNMGAKLAIWDSLFGTLIKSNSVKTLKFGLGIEDDKNYDSFLKNLYMPFVNIFKRLSRVIKR
jgi:sterol desaturase/sphingolipid hydroxylase (fatty acid hydroxylase superfamily)